MIWSFHTLQGVFFSSPLPFKSFYLSCLESSFMEEFVAPSISYWCFFVPYRWCEISTRCGQSTNIKVFGHFIHGKKWTISALLMFFPAMSLICSTWHIFLARATALKPMFFLPRATVFVLGQHGDSFWHHALGKRCRWPACAFRSCTFGIPQFGTWWPTRKKT